jgi:hypothetical protein
MARGRRIIALAVASAVHLFESSIAAAAQPSVTPTDVLWQLTGTWKASEDRTPRETPLDEEVFGKGAFGVRNVTLVIRRTGDGTLRVHTAIVDHNGCVYAPSLIEVRLRLGELVASAADGAVGPTVMVVSAVKRELDPPYERWPLDGVRLDISLPVRTKGVLNVHLDTRDGRDGFGVTLERRG